MAKRKAKMCKVDLSRNRGGRKQGVVYKAIASLAPGCGFVTSMARTSLPKTIQDTGTPNVITRKMSDDWTIVFRLPEKLPVVG